MELSFNFASEDAINFSARNIILELLQVYQKSNYRFLRKVNGIKTHGRESYPWSWWPDRL